jgi:predicted AlkP superfamily pyrophosphatase or phosphodiesterase
MRITCVLGYWQFLNTSKNQLLILTGSCDLNLIVMMNYKFLAILFLGICFVHTTHAQRAKHVVLISIDGFRPEFYLDKKWPAPNLQRMMSKGAYATEVNSVFPSVTYPSHTTIITGASPARHGIYYNSPINAKKGQWYWEESYIRTSTLWDAIRDKGLTSGSVMWPVTVGAPIDYNFPVKRADDDQSANQLEVTLPFVSPANLMEDFQKQEGKLNSEDFNTSNSIDVTIARLGSYIITRHKPDFVALHFITADHQQHSYGRNAPEVKQAVALIDSMIGKITAAVEAAGLKDKTDYIITGDHGFVDASKTFAPNVLLQQHQLFNTAPGLRFVASGGAAFLHAKDSNDQASGKKVIDLLNNLTAEQKKSFRIIDRAALDSIGANPEVLLGLAMSKDYVATNNSKGELFSSKKLGGAHGYYPDFKEISTGFIAYGPDILQNKITKKKSIADMAPLISALLDLQFTSPDGVIIPGIIRP